MDFSHSFVSVSREISKSFKVAVDIVSSSNCLNESEFEDTTNIEKFVVPVKVEGKILSYATTLFMQLRK